MNTRLEKFCVKHNIIDEKQASHKKSSRTSDNVFILDSLFNKYCVKEKGKLFSWFIDFKKAFDSVWHEGLFLKLLRHDIGGPFYKVLKVMYDNVFSSLKIDGHITNQF